jgi:hypothetical protein
MIRRSLWLLLVVLCGVGPQGTARAASAEVKLDREYLAGLIEKMPPLPFKAEKSHGTVHDYHLVAIDPRTRRFLIAAVVDGEFRSALGGPWRSFRFEVRVGINAEAGADGTPKFRIAVDEVRRKEIEGLAGTLARLLGKYFDDVATKVAAGKASQLSDKLNAEIVKKVAAFEQYGVFAGIEYAPDLIVLSFAMTRFKAEGVAGHVFPVSATEPPPPGTVPLYRAVRPKLGARLYTTDRAEVDRLGYRLEGVACHVYDRNVPEAVPLYRWRSRRDDFYTTVRDGEGCARLGYRPDGIACLLYPEAKPGTVPLFRFIDPRTGQHFYTLHPHAEFAR